ncbi:MAG: carboxypeptidase-like regulatory domain-containing protein [Armatimonadetes bacterium]|nr:carboxypeptidase-like regulatory domain-containing protein [Armatimonadota bacterium]MDW8026793.1 carboxypeptidase-like regulatory domain-containing protein [Armatimonadota bacterium]
MKAKVCEALLVMALTNAIIGCASYSGDCPNPNTLRGFVYIRQGALNELDGTLDDDVIVIDRSQPPEGFLPFKGAKVTVEETGSSVELGERGAFVFHPLPAGTYTLVIKFENFPPIKRQKEVCVLSLPSTYYYRPPYDYDPPTRPPTVERPTQGDTSGSWDDGGLSSWGEGESASARRQ